MTQNEASSFVLFTGEGHLALRSPTRKDAVALLDAKTGKVVRQVKLPCEWLTAARVVEDDVLLCVGYNTLYRIDCRKGTLLDRCDLEVTEGSDAIAFSPDGAYVASAGAAGLTLCDTQDGRAYRALATPSPLTRCAFSDDGTRIIAGDDAGRVYLFAVER